MSLLIQNLRRSAEVDPDKAAFRFDGQDLSYGRLAERSNQLAATLRSAGVAPGDRVGILQGKGMDNPLAVYGILAAGAAYVPIDPAAPVARQSIILEDCGIEHLVTDTERAGRAAKLAAGRADPLTIYGVAAPDGESPTLDPSTGVGPRFVDWDEIHTAPSAAPAIPADPDLSAYIIFTSGSTGVPKGIVHRHRSGAAYATMAAELYGLTAQDRLSNFPPLHFDQSTFDIFSGPLVGATTVIIGKDHQLVPASLSRLIEDERLTVWYSVPLALTQLLAYGVLDERDHTSLRLVVYGGEPFPVKHLAALMAHWPAARFSNCYGPAETNQCTYHHLDGPSDLPADDAGGIPIGVACPGMTTLVVDEHDRPVEPGQDGQLLVSSPTTMAGYWGRPDLNERVFHHVTGTGGAERYYRTGDVVRQRSDGLLDFVGRADRQIKIRGIRVELDEIETVLSDHDAVQEVAVAARPGEDGPTIEAWVSLRPGQEANADAAGLRRHGARQLPRPAVPTTITVVDGFPRTTSGKIDYRALVGEGADRAGVT